MELELRSVLDHGIDKSLDVLNLGFFDYLVPIQLDLPHFHEMLRTADIDVSLSQVVFRGSEAVGVALIARRGWSSRLAGMSIVPKARGQKVGQWLMEQLIEQAKDRGDHRMELEVIQQNEAAVRLYQKVGFRTMRQLFGYRLESPPGKPTALEKVDIRFLANLVSNYGLPNLPWQLSGESLAVTGPPHQAYCSESAYVVITDPQSDQIILRSILTLPEAREKGQAKNLLRGLFAQFPGKTWIVPAIFPAEMASFLEGLGFERQQLSQFQMELLLQ